MPKLIIFWPLGAGTRVVQTLKANGEIPTAGEALGDDDGRIVAGLDDQALDQVVEADGLVDRQEHRRAAGIGAALAPTQAAEPRAAAGALDISALISRAQQRAQRAAWGVNKAETELGSLWTEIAGSLLGGSSQQLGESAADQSATQALAAQVQQVVLRPTGGRAGAEASQSI